MKRILLLLATNLAIVLVLSITMRLLGVEPYLRELGFNLQALLIFAAVWVLVACSSRWLFPDGWATVVNRPIRNWCR